MADERVQWNEEAVGANHATKADTANRLPLIAHNNDGTPKHRGCALYSTTDPSIPDSTATIVSWDAENTDTDGLHSTVSNTSRITIPAALNGRYGVFTVFIRWNANSTGERVVEILKNGATFYPMARDKRAAQGDTSIVIPTCRIALVTGDYYEIKVSQTSGGNLTILGSLGGVYQSFFALDVY